MTLSLADSPLTALQMAETPGGELAGGFGRFTRKLAGFASTFAPPGATAILSRYATSPELRPGNRGGGNPNLEPAQQFQPMPTLPATYSAPGFPMVQAPATGLLTPKNLIIGGGIIVALVVGYSILHKK